MTAVLLCAALVALQADPASSSAPQHAAELIFPLHNQHNHAPGIVELPIGDLFVSWYRGSGERSADDVAVFGSRRTKGSATWSEPFLLAVSPTARQKSRLLRWNIIPCQENQTDY